MSGGVRYAAGAFGAAAITGGTIKVDDGAVGSPSIAFASALTTGLYLAGGALNVAVGGTRTAAYDTTTFYTLGAISVGGGAVNTNASMLISDASNTLAQKNGATDQLFRKYGGNGGYVEWGSVSENLTLSTSGATTDTTANLLPANSYIESVTGRVTTTITTATSWQLGDPTTAGRFTAAQSGGQLTAAATIVGLVHCDVTGTGGPRQTAAAKVRVTTVGTPGAGAIRITSYYRAYVPATS